jgi:AbiV family abortive infection protein
MTPEHNKPEKPRSERLLATRALCFDHARDLIEAAERLLLEARPLANISFHLVLLAIEEMGKAGLITSREVSTGNRDTSWIDKRLDDHAFKLLWGLWSQAFHDSREFDPGKFRQLKEFSERAHVQRLAGLYVEAHPENDANVAPRDAVSLQETEALLDIAKQNLGLFLAENSPDIDTEDNLLKWFWETVEDGTKRLRLFSAPFAAKYTEFKDSPREWLRWAQNEFARIKDEEEALLKAELSRTASKTLGSISRWRLNVRLYCASHSIRPKVLNAWNENVPLAKLKFINSGELLLELTLGDHVNIGSVFDAGLSLSKLITACLSIGTAGYFWFELPTPSANYFEKIEDLANPHMKLDIDNNDDLQRHWLLEGPRRKLTVLEDSNLQHAAKCAIAFGPMRDAEAEPIFGAYLTGLTLLGKSDIHMSLDAQALAAFDAALRNSLKYFEDWDGEATSLLPTLHRLFSDVIPEPGNRDKIFGYFGVAPKSVREIQDYAVSAKRVVDLYLVIVANRLSRRESTCADRRS